MCSADILVVFVNFSVQALFSCFSLAKLYIYIFGRLVTGRSGDV